MAPLFRVKNFKEYSSKFEKNAKLEDFLLGEYNCTLKNQLECRSEEKQKEMRPLNGKRNSAQTTFSPQKLLEPKKEKEDKLRREFFIDLQLEIKLPKKQLNESTYYLDCIVLQPMQRDLFVDF